MTSTRVPSSGRQCRLSVTGDLEPLAHPGLQHDHQLAVGGGEVVDVARRAAARSSVAASSSPAADSRQTTPRPPNRPRFQTRPSGSTRGWARKAHALQVVAQGDEAAGLERRGIDRGGRAALPQRPQLAADRQHRGVGGVEVVGAPDRPRRALPALPKPGMTMAPAAVSARRLGVSTKRPARVARPSFDAEGAHEAVAVEPVGQRAPAGELGRPVAVEGPGQARGRAAVDQAAARAGRGRLRGRSRRAPIRRTRRPRRCRAAGRLRPRPPRRRSTATGARGRGRRSLDHQGLRGALRRRRRTRRPTRARARRARGRCWRRRRARSGMPIRLVAISPSPSRSWKALAA